jgi:hypothetical protein
VSSNLAHLPRAATFTVAAETLKITQDPAPCRFELSRSQAAAEADGGRVAVDVSTPDGCTWSAVSGDGWIVVTSGASGSAGGTVGLEVAPNTGGSRTGAVTIAGIGFTIVQSAGTPATPSPTPPAPEPPPPTAPEPTPPAPAPPEPDTGDLQFQGEVIDVSGRCPDLTFSVAGYAVVTDENTDYSDVSCRDLERKSRSVIVVGVLRDDGRVRAVSIVRLRD